MEQVAILPIAVTETHSTDPILSPEKKVVKVPFYDAVVYYFQRVEYHRFGTKFPRDYNCFDIPIFRRQFTRILAKIYKKRS